MPEVKVIAVGGTSILLRGPYSS